MGEDPDVNAYDEDKVSQYSDSANRKIFSHLVFYIDTPKNAEENGLASSSPSQEAVQRCDPQSM